MFRKTTGPKHRARKTLSTRRREREVARERAAWFMQGRTYPTAVGDHAADVKARA